jgi:hypothetical protein
MKIGIIFIISLVLLCASCTKQTDKTPAAGNSISDRLDVINRARAVQRKQNEAIESQNKLIEDISKKHRGQVPAN